MPLNVEYAKELQAVFKILQFSVGTGLIVSIFVADIYRSSLVGIFLLFIAIIATLTSVFFFVIHLSSYVYKLPGPVTLIELICIQVCCILALIAMITAAATSGKSGAAISSAILFAVSFVFYGIDAFILFSYYRLNGGYLNDPKTKQRPNLPSKTNQKPEVTSPEIHSNYGFENEWK
ncbi:hypothetical protein MN116_008386 [Schistosoma mekongi]|uniref:MARVEL domain-containing protein n=1 Tax=Schistosoma mekongi TaxID=38744 RepID=A0AAE1Z631_SCHME|nr:hypothetical protein MN116_008386 [Schistosoma mekongi]